MRTKLPSINYGLLAAAREELAKAEQDLRNVSRSPGQEQDVEDRIEDASWLAMCSVKAETAERAVLEFFNAMDNYCDAPGAAEVRDE